MVPAKRRMSLELREPRSLCNRGSQAGCIHFRFTMWRRPHEGSDRFRVLDTFCFLHPAPLTCSIHPTLTRMPPARLPPPTTAPRPARCPKLADRLIQLICRGFEYFRQVSADSVLLARKNVDDFVTVGTSKLAEEAGLTVEELIRLLDAGLSVGTLLTLIAQRLDGKGLRFIDCAVVRLVTRACAHLPRGT